MKFKKYKLGELGIVYSGGTPSTKNNEYWNGNISWITPKDLARYNGKYISYGERNITKLGLEKSSAVLIPKGGVIMSSRAPIGYIAMAEKELTTNQGFKSIFCDETKCKNEYMYYWLSNNVKKIKDNANGSTFKEISGTDFKNIMVDIPNLDIQNRIIKILSSIDKKIELNKEINNNLHNLCNNLYYKLYNSLNDNNSSNVQIKNVAKCILGGTPSRDKQEYWNGNINWINSGEINKFRIIKASEKITKLGLNKSSTTLLPKGTTVLAITGATLGQVSRLEINSCANQSVIGIVTNNEKLNNYMYLNILNNIGDLVLKQTGGAQQHINKNDVETHELLIPNNDDVINEFDLKISPLFKKISLNCFEIEKLEQLRCILLPKLINGEIDLDNIEI